MQAPLPLAALALALLGGGISTDYSAARALRSVMETSLELETTSVAMDDGPSVDVTGASLEQRTVEQTYRVLEHADGRPTTVRRAFETVRRERKESPFGLEVERKEEGPLQGVTLEFTLADGEVLVEVVDGEKPDVEAVLEGHALTLACDGLLPAGDATDDETWELSSGAILRALALDLENAYFPAGPESDLGENGPLLAPMRPSAFRSLAAAEWKGRATREGEVELDGVACLEIGLQLQAEGETKAFFGGRGNTIEAKLEGRLLFALEGRRPVLLELKGEVATELHEEFERRDGRHTIHTEQEGTFTLRARLAAEEEEHG